MDGDEVDGAVGAGSQELIEPLEPRVCDGRGGDLGAPGKRLHVCFVAGDGLSGAEVGLGPEVGFVEGEEVGGARGDGGRRGGLPAGGVYGLKTPEHGHELEGAGKAGGR